MSKFESKLPAELSNQAIHATVPISYLWGIQRCDEYCTKKTKNVARGLKENGLHFLEEHPVLAGLVSIENGSIIIIINGHHRVREAPNHNIVSVPTQILSSALLANYFDLPQQEFEVALKEWSSQAVYDFDRKITSSGKLFTPPNVLTKVKSLQEVKNLLQGENYFPMLAVAQLALH